jgi:hypothetical protein
MAAHHRESESSGAGVIGIDAQSDVDFRIVPYVDAEQVRRMR